MDVLLWHQWLFALSVAWLVAWTAWEAAGALMRARTRRAAAAPQGPATATQPAPPGR